MRNISHGKIYGGLGLRGEFFDRYSVNSIDFKKTSALTHGRGMSIYICHYIIRAIFKCIYFQKAITAFALKFVFFATLWAVYHY